MWDAGILYIFMNTQKYYIFPYFMVLKEKTGFDTSLMFSRIIELEDLVNVKQSD